MTRRLSLAVLAIVACAPRANTVDAPARAPSGTDATGTSSQGTDAAASGQVQAIAVNQLGYLPQASKWATVVIAAPDPMPWQLLDTSGQVVAQGQTIVFGPDRSSGDTVHRVDFSSFETAGSGYRLKAGDAESPPFAIDRELYASLRLDALHFFYHQRSGVPIEMPYAKSEAWVRQAGHLGDAKVECLPELECGFALDVRGGWYDAGDHGKYVVNGGISAWTLLNLYERAVNLAKREEVFGDGKVAIPEVNNGVDDLLDEARFELEFLLRMQVPASAKKWKGMAVHKVHDENWTPLPTDPAQSKVARYLHAPSTAATLNLAAVAAQAARIWKTTDPKFSSICAKAAERAWKAAKANPEMYAVPADTTGGGPYDDDDVSDEFYWAASELYLATKKAEYLEALQSSPHFAVLPPQDQTAMDWKKVAALGTISLLTAGGADESLQAKARHAILAVADAYVATVEAEGYRTPLPATEANAYPWGSNSWVLNNAIILALAHDLTQDPRYLQAVVSGMDYVMGRNAMHQCYVTGYGAKPLQNPHHRFWARQLDPSSPVPPPGIVSGGPNSALQDPYAQKAGLPGCAPQKCFVDHIESWSTNEITINWNAPLVWVTDYLHHAG